MMRPAIALLLGDPAGIGPEIAVKLLAEGDVLRSADVLILTDPVMLAAGERVAGAKVAHRLCRSLSEVAFEAGRPTLLAADLLQGEAPVPGKATLASGRAALLAIETAVAAARLGLVQGIVFAPLNKQAMKLAGLAHEDELRLMQALFEVDGFTSEFNITGDLWTSRVTSHIPLREVADTLTVEGVCDAIAIVHHSLRAAGIERPRIGVAALNPHAGDGGNCGREEITTIAPAVERMRGTGVDARGPFPADTIFVAARAGEYDAIVSMYHDQGQIAMKLLGFEGGVTLHGGLPVPVATCASGTAYDIAGRGVARFEGLKNAFALAAKMARATRAGKELISPA
jgi:4-hydroxythreonine-4-phosphate dehydrogenase